VKCFDGRTRLANRNQQDMDLVFNSDDPHERSAHIEKLFWGTTSIALDSDGHVLVVDSNRHRFQIFDVVTSD
jgi:hypothetical protein